MKETVKEVKTHHILATNCLILITTLRRGTKLSIPHAKF